jgi:pre-mRNA-splicing factor ATP-dependent RNA helicase DHX38/PRP16
MAPILTCKQWLADLGGVFYSVREKGYSIRDKRVTEQEFSRKMEIEAKMAEDREREAQRLAKLAEGPKTAGGRPATVFTTSGTAARRPATAVVKPSIRRPATGLVSHKI